MTNTKPKYDHHKASYAAALEAWRRVGTPPGREPRWQAFGLTPEEAVLVFKLGYDTSGLPTPLRPKEAP